MDSTFQAVSINSKQPAAEQLQHHTVEVTAAQGDYHGLIRDKKGRCDLLAKSQVYQMHKDTHGLSNSSYHHAVASTITAEHCEHSAMLPQNTVSKIESCTATESSLDAVLAEATSAFSTIDCATDALLVITALLVNWQDQATTGSVQKVCSVLQETIAMLRGAITTSPTAAAEASQATLYAARAAFDELDTTCEALLSMIALLADWKQGILDSSKRRVIGTMRAAIALLSNSVCITSSCDGVSDVVETSVRSRTVAAATTAMPVHSDVAAAAALQSKVAADNTQATSNSTAQGATQHTRDVSTQTDKGYMSYAHVSTQTNEGYMSYKQLQQQISTLTVLLKKHDPKPDTAYTTKTEALRPYDYKTRQRSSSHTTASTDGATAAAPVHQHKGEHNDNTNTHDTRLRYERERMLAKGYSVDNSIQQCPRYYSKYGPGEHALLPTYDGYGSLAQQVVHSAQDQPEHALVVIQIKGSEVGAVMGMHGEIIQAIQQQYAVKIDIDGSKDDFFREVSIRSTSARSDVAAAALAVETRIASKYT
jgi:KH domain